MKRLYSLLTLLPLFVLAQKEPIDTVQFLYSGVVKVDSVNAKTLQDRARAFVAEKLPNGPDLQHLVELDDTAVGVMIVKVEFVPHIIVHFKNIRAGLHYCTWKLQFRDGRYKYTFSDFVDSGDGQHKWTIGGPLNALKPACGRYHIFMSEWRDIKNSANNQAIAWITDLDRSMRRQSNINTKKDDF